jgi:hypothetical protein
MATQLSLRASPKSAPAVCSPASRTDVPDRSTSMSTAMAPGAHDLHFIGGILGDGELERDGEDRAAAGHWRRRANGGG